MYSVFLGGYAPIRRALGVTFTEWLHYSDLMQGFNLTSKEYSLNPGRVFCQFGCSTIFFDKFSFVDNEVSFEFSTPMKKAKEKHP